MIVLRRFVVLRGDVEMAPSRGEKIQRVYEGDDHPPEWRVSGAYYLRGWWKLGC